MDDDVDKAYEFPGQSEAELRRAYEFGPLWREDADKAYTNFQVVRENVKLEAAYVEAKSSTGTRYEVMVTETPPKVREWTELTHIVSVLHPWSRAFGMHLDLTNSIHLSWIREKLTIDGIVHGGDLVCTTLAIVHGVQLLKRRAGIETELKVIY